MEEQSYRQSRLCRLLGNPVAFAIVELLENHELTPSEIARAVGRSVPRVSNVLGALRLVKSCGTIRMESAVATDSSTRVKSRVLLPLFPAS